MNSLLKIAIGAVIGCLGYQIVKCTIEETERINNLKNCPDDYAEDAPRSDGDAPKTEQNSSAGTT
jgi:hypothetical protein